MELAVSAGFAEKKLKLEIVQKISNKFDALKFFLKLAWELKIIDHKKYANLALPLSEAGKMLGGWQKMLKETLPGGRE